MVLLLFLAAPALAGERIVMVFGTGYPPFYLEGPMDRPQSGFKGMFVELMEAFDRENGNYDLEFMRLPRKRMDLWMHTRQAQAFSLNSPLFVASDRRDDFLFSRTIWTTGDHLMVLADSPLAYQGPQSLYGKRLGIILGNSYGPLDPHLESGDILTSTGHREDHLLRMLVNHRVDAIVGNRHAAKYYLQQMDIDSSLVRFLDPALYEFDLMIQVIREKPGFVREVDDFLRRAEQNGLKARIERRWLGESPESAADY